MHGLCTAKPQAKRVNVRRVGKAKLPLAPPWSVLQSLLTRKCGWRATISAPHTLAMLSLRRAFSSLKSTRTCGLFRLRQVLAVHSHKKRRRPIVRLSSGAILFIKADMSPSKKLIIGNFGHCVAISVKGKPVLKTMASYISFKRNRPETY